MVEGASFERSKPLRSIIEKRLQPPGCEIIIAGKAKRRQEANPDNFGEFGQDGYVLSKDGNSLIVFDGISTYGKDAYPFAQAIAHALAEEQQGIRELNTDPEAIKFLLEGVIDNAKAEKKGGMVFSGFIRLSEDEFLFIKTGDCPICIQRSSGEIEQILAISAANRQVHGGIAHDQEKFQLQVAVVKMRPGDKIYIASDGITNPRKRIQPETELIDRINAKESPADMVKNSTFEDDVIVAEITLKLEQEQRLAQAV